MVTKQLSKQELSSLSKLSIYNKKRLLQNNLCGCYYCGRIFNPKEIKEWTDNLDTAICPYCAIDSVLDEVNGGTNLNILEQMHQRFFLKGYNSKGEEIDLTDNRDKKFNEN